MQIAQQLDPQTVEELRQLARQLPPLTDDQASAVADTLIALRLAGEET